jgi:hypothetical protein
MTKRFPDMWIYGNMNDQYSVLRINVCALAMKTAVDVARFASAHAMREMVAVDFSVSDMGGKHHYPTECHCLPEPNTRRHWLLVPDEYASRYKEPRH